MESKYDIEKKTENLFEGMTKTLGLTSGIMAAEIYGFKKFPFEGDFSTYVSSIESIGKFVIHASLFTVISPVFSAPAFLLSMIPAGITAGLYYKYQLNKNQLSGNELEKNRKMFDKIHTEKLKEQNKLENKL